MLPNDGYYRATIHVSGTGVPRGAAMIHAGGNGSAFDAAEIAERVVVALATADVGAAMSNTVGIVGVTVKLGPDATGPMAFQGANIPGEVPGSAASPQVAFLLHKRTAAGGRRGSGRTFVPGVWEAAVDQSGVVLGAIVTQLNTLWTAYLAALATAEVDMYLEHEDQVTWQIVNGRPRAVPVPGTAPAPTPVLSISADPTIATQRRRVR